IVAPYRGTLRQDAPNQVIISVAGMRDVDIILTNIEVEKGVVGREVVAGDYIGIVNSPDWCSDAHLHVAMRRGSDKYIDPTNYIQKRANIGIKWDQGCDRYVLIYKGTTIEEGKFLSGEQGKRKDEKLEINDADIGGQIGQLSVSTRRKRAAGNQGSWSETLEDNMNLTSHFTMGQIAHVFLYYKVKKEDNTIKITVGISYCSKREDECQPLTTLLDDVVIAMGSCNSRRRRKKRDVSSGKS
ncbi:hypothetical protein LSAT2_010285, partial [Lamellibrachia satsuma]